MATSIIIFFAIIFGIPFLLVELMLLDQKQSYKKNKKGNESYDQYCKRNWTRYV